MTAVVVAVVLTGAVAGIAATEHSNRLGLYLVRRCNRTADCLRSGVVRRMQNEASQIWSSDVRLDWIDSAGAGPPRADEIDLTVVLEETADPRVYWPGHRGLLLAVIHQPDVPCGPGLTRLWASEARRHAASVQVQGVPFSNLPAKLADLFLGRSLGRALAHEIGHYLLGHAEHAPRGLMRARFSPSELLEAVTGARYGLDRRHREALRPCRSAARAPVVTSTHPGLPQD